MYHGITDIKQGFHQVWRELLFKLKRLNAAVITNES